MICFPNYIDEDNPNSVYFRVHPLKQKQLRDILSIVPVNIDEIWVFGSATDLSCWNESDLDLMVIGNFTEDATYEICKIFYTQATAKGHIDLLFDTKDNFVKGSKEINNVYCDVMKCNLKVFDRKKVGR